MSVALWVVLAFCTNALVMAADHNAPDSRLGAVSSWQPAPLLNRVVVIAGSIVIPDSTWQLYPESCYQITVELPTRNVKDVQHIFQLCLEGASVNGSLPIVTHVELPAGAELEPDAVSSVHCEQRSGAYLQQWVQRAKLQGMMLQITVYTPSLAVVVSDAERSFADLKQASCSFPPLPEQQSTGSSAAPAHQGNDQKVWLSSSRTEEYAKLRMCPPLPGLQQHLGPVQQQVCAAALSIQEQGPAAAERRAPPTELLAWCAGVAVAAFLAGFWTANLTTSHARPGACALAAPAGAVNAHQPEAPNPPCATPKSERRRSMPQQGDDDQQLATSTSTPPDNDTHHWARDSDGRLRRYSLGKTGTEAGVRSTESCSFRRMLYYEE